MELYPETELIKAVPDELNIAGDSSTPIAEHLVFTLYYEELMDALHKNK